MPCKNTQLYIGYLNILIHGVLGRWWVGQVIITVACFGGMYNVTLVISSLFVNEFSFGLCGLVEKSVFF